MKNLKWTAILIPLLLVSLIFISSDRGEATSSITSLPKLLQRSTGIQAGSEWDKVQNLYSDQVNTLRKRPEDFTAKLQLSQLFVKEARVTGEHGHYYPAALQMLDEALLDTGISKSDKFMALTTKAGVQLSLHEFHPALETAKAAILLNNRNAQIYGVLVDCYVELGKYDKAIAASDKMVSMKPDLRSYSRVSYLREIHGNVDGAIEAMTMAVKAGFPGEEETAWAMLTLGEMYERYDMPDKAKIVYHDILKLRPQYPFAVAALADMQLKEGKLKEGENSMDEAIELIPEVGFYLSKAELYKKQGQKQKFESIMEEIYVMLQDDVDAGHNMNLEYADIYMELDTNLDKAKEFLLIEQNSRPENIDVNRRLAKYNLLTGDKRKAQEYYSKALLTNSKHPELKEIQLALKSS